MTPFERRCINQKIFEISRNNWDLDTLIREFKIIETNYKFVGIQPYLQGPIFAFPDAILEYVDEYGSVLHKVFKIGFTVTPYLCVIAISMSEENHSLCQYRYAHPHIEEGGHICLGDENQKVYDEFRQQGFLFYMLEICNLVIQNYDPDSCFLPLSEWEKEEMEEN